MTHERARELLSLAAAGALSREESLRLRAHAAACPDCSRRLRLWDELAERLRALPEPSAPPALLARTRAAIAIDLDARARRRQEALLLGVLVLLSWALLPAAWAAWSLPAGKLAPTLSQAVAWLATSAVLSWITGGVAAFMLRRRTDAPGSSL